MRVVHSRLNDEQAVERMRQIVQDHPRAAEATLSHQTDIQSRTNGYIPDRAYRIIVAAVRNTPPVAVSPENAAQFEREKELGWLPLEEAFSHLAAIVPELRTIAEQGAALPPPTDFDRSLTQAYRQVRRDAAKLVGPKSTNQDALVTGTRYSRLLMTSCLSTTTSYLGAHATSRGRCSPRSLTGSIRGLQTLAKTSPLLSSLATAGCCWRRLSRLADSCSATRERSTWLSHTRIFRLAGSIESSASCNARKTRQDLPAWTEVT